MANLASPSREEEVFLENGRLSYENPNYQLHFDSVRLDDALNSNTEPSLASLVSLAALGLDMDILPSQLANMDLAMELDLVSRVGDKLAMNQMNSTRNRRTYASLDVHSMGVNVDVGPVMNLGSPDFDNNRTGRSLTGNVFNRGYSNSNFADRSGDAPMDLASPSSEDSPAEGDADVGGARGSTSSSTSILSVSEPAPVHGRPIAFSASQKTTWTNEDASMLDSQSTLDETEEKAWFGQENVLPLGWEKHEDADGPYYWHIKSGTIQREPPSKPTSLVNKADFKRQMIREAEAVAMPDCIQSPVLPCVPRSTTSFALSDLDAGRFKEEAAYKRRSYPASLASEPKEKPIRFAVRSLGWVEIAEEDLTPERSSKAVNRCIVDLSLGRHDLLDVVGRWGDGKDLFMDLDEGSLKLVDPETLTVLNTQPIHTIRVWGVGRDNGRDFAYVARDRTTRRHMCHVFRCDTPARTIANTLRDICKKIMIERNLVQSLSKPVFQDAGSKAMIRPSNLPTEQRRHVSRGGQFLAGQCFPTPMEEPRKVLKASYVGCTPVQRPTGIEVLNDAIDRLVGSIPASEWKQVNVSVAPSVVTITPPDDDSQVLLECRVRFLSFMGIGHNVKHCGFIVHTAHDEFQAHIFDCQPSSGALCKTIEAACKLRYQKCLDAHGALRGRANAAGQYNPALTPTGSARSIESIGAALKSVWGSFSLKRDKANSGGATVGNS